MSLSLPLQVNAIMAEVDVDHNGKMDLAEFIVMMHNQVARGHLIIRGESLFLVHPCNMLVSLTLIVSDS